MKGGGLSSSAAFEVLIGTVLNHLYNGGLVDPQRIAQVGQFAENQYFGKQCGLMDQMVSAVGGFVSINFGTSQPTIRQIPFDFRGARHHLCVTEVGSSHENLSGEYSAIPAEMKEVAACFGREVLSQVSPEDFRIALPHLHGRVSDRAILRAAHFFGETRRAEQQAQALEKGDFPRFLELVRQSGLSSFRWLQNIFAPQTPPISRCPWRFWPANRCLENGAPAGSMAGDLPGLSRPLCRTICSASMKRPWRTCSAREAATAWPSVPGAGCACIRRGRMQSEE